ncbi:iron chaperone [Microbulbifer guangxiensis]|uniref:iron chaperone n=1 Tax=Microbulbifer guangxiensis TaxID=2904249 RepID=UPI001F230E87|nr:DUF1801 domain-containing protein [Microbulbifer guangxiensis]
MVQVKELIDDYTCSLAPLRRERVEALHHFILTQYPDAQVSLQYRMPTYHHGKGWVSVASQRHHVSLYTCDRHHIQPYIDRHPDVKCGKGCLNFRDGDDIDWAALEPVLLSAFSKDH